MLYSKDLIKIKRISFIYKRLLLIIKRRSIVELSVLFDPKLKKGLHLLPRMYTTRHARIPFYLYFINFDHLKLLAFILTYSISSMVLNM